MTEPEIDGYHSLVRIGSGGLGDVFRAVDRASGATVAIKVLRDVSDSSVAWHRTRRELTALETLSGHANVIRPIAMLELAGGPALVMEYAPGGSVADLLDDQPSPSRRRLTVDQTVFVGRQTTGALIAAHAQGIVHRDIKPQNLLIDGDGQVKLCDFGIATLTADDRYRTCTNAVSMRYSSPEDLEHDDPVGPAADIYSLGATLLHLVHGAPPTLRDRLTPWEPPATRDPDLAALDAVIAACLDPDPARRPTAEQLLQSLDDCVLDSGRTGVCELPVVDRVLPLIRFDDVPIDLHEALTLQPPERPDEAIELERPLMLARPKVDGSPRAAFVAAAAAAAVVLLIVGTFVALSAITTSHAAKVAGPITTPRPPGLDPLEEVDWSPGGLGDCLAQLTNTTQLKVTTCDTPHDLQRYHEGSVSPEMTPVQAAQVVDTSCEAAFESFVGQTSATSDLDIAQTLPSTESWQAGDRSFACYVGTKSHRIQGDARASGW